jgi:prolipoprotein diacylglyceryltransferase
LAHFVFWYCAQRLLVGLFRDYEAYVLGLGTGQCFHLAMALAGVVLQITLRGESPPKATGAHGVPRTETGPASIGVWRVAALTLPEHI